MTNDEIKSRARAALARALKIPPERISDDASQLSLLEWDSVHHMNVVLALESDFDIEFEDSELMNLTSLAQMVAAIARHRERRT